MPRIAMLRFTKDYETVADALAGMVKNATVTKRTENERSVIDVEGDFEHFVLEDMDTWGGYLKFEVMDNALQGDNDREARSILASAEPAWSAVLFSPTTAKVYRRTSYTLRTTTVLERIENDQVVKQIEKQTEESDLQYEWVDITREFGQKVRIDN